MSPYFKQLAWILEASKMQGQVGIIHRLEYSILYLHKKNPSLDDLASRGVSEWGDHPMARLIGVYLYSLHYGEGRPSRFEMGEWRAY